MQYYKYAHTHTHTHSMEWRTRRCQATPTPGDLVEGTKEGQILYLSGGVPVECVRLMPASLTAAKGSETVCTGAQREPAQVEPLGAQPSQKGSQPHSPSQNQIQFTCPLCSREKTYQGTAARVSAHQREAHSGEGNSLLEKLGRPLQKTRRSNRYGVGYKCVDLHTNLSRHSSGCDRTPPDTIPSHLMDWVTTPLRETQQDPRPLLLLLFSITVPIQFNTRT